MLDEEQVKCFLSGGHKLNIDQVNNFLKHWEERVSTKVATTKKLDKMKDWSIEGGAEPEMDSDSDKSVHWRDEDLETIKVMEWNHLSDLDLRILGQMWWKGIHRSPFPLMTEATVFIALHIKTPEPKSKPFLPVPTADWIDPNLESLTKMFDAKGISKVENDIHRMWIERRLIEDQSIEGAKEEENPPPNVPSYIAAQFYPFMAMILCRLCAKTVPKVQAMWTRAAVDRFHEFFGLIPDFSIKSSSVPLEVAKIIHDQLNDSHLIKTLLRSVLTVKLQPQGVNLMEQRILDDTILTSISGNGIHIIDLILRVTRFSGFLNLAQTLRALWMPATARSITRIFNYWLKFGSSGSTKSVLYNWSRLLNSNYFLDLSTTKNQILQWYLVCILSAEFGGYPMGKWVIYLTEEKKKLIFDKSRIYRKIYGDCE